MISVNLQNPIRAIAVEHDAGEFHAPFSAVTISEKNGSEVTLFLPGGSGAAVAAAINAAIGGQK